MHITINGTPLCAKPDLVHRIAEAEKLWGGVINPPLNCGHMIERTAERDIKVLRYLYPTPNKLEIVDAPCPE